MDTPTKDILFDTTLVNDHKDLLDDVYKYANRFVVELMERKFSYRRDEYTWCIAGGFGAYILGKTTEYQDIDIYIISDRPVLTMCAPQIQVNRFKFDIILVSYMMQKMTPLVKICSVLCEFDMDICRCALINGGRHVLSVSTGDVVTSLERIYKYEKRINNNFDCTQIKWKHMTIEQQSELVFFDYHGETLKNLCSRVAERHSNLN